MFFLFAEYDVQKLEIIPFVVVMNMIREELVQRAPEMYLTLISLLHQYDSASDCAQQQYDKVKYFISQSHVHK